MADYSAEELLSFIQTQFTVSRVMSVVWSSLFQIPIIISVQDMRIVCSLKNIFIMLPSRGIPISIQSVLSIQSIFKTH